MECAKSRILGTLARVRPRRIARQCTTRPSNVGFQPLRSPPGTLREAVYGRCPKHVPRSASLAEMDPARARSRATKYYSPMITEPSRTWRVSTRSALTRSSPACPRLRAARGRGPRLAGLANASSTPTALSAPRGPPDHGRPPPSRRAPVPLAAADKRSLRSPRLAQAPRRMPAGDGSRPGEASNTV